MCKKVGQYIAKRQKTESSDEKKALVKQLTSLQIEGGQLPGGMHKDTYNHSLLQKVAEKAQKDEKKKKLQEMKTIKKWLSTQKTLDTKKKKKEAAKATVVSEAAASSSGPK